MGINENKILQKIFHSECNNQLFLESAAQNIRNITNENLVFSKRIFVVRKCCVNAVKLIVVMTPLPTNTNSAAKVGPK